MPISPALRQAGSLKGNSKGCQKAGIKWARGVLAIMHGDNSNNRVAGTHHHNSSLEPGVRKPPLNSNQPIPGVARVPPSNNLRPGVTRTPVPHLEVLAREETNQPGMQL